MSQMFSTFPYYRSGNVAADIGNMLMQPSESKSYFSNMKNAINSRFFLLVIATILLLASAACSSQNKEIRSILDAADALVMAQPEAALDTLSIIKDIEAKSLNQADRAFYTLLKTEAEYKSYLPVAQDTAIMHAVRFYSSNGPDDLLARALMMQGAVYLERNELSRAMESYKAAEPLLESIGDFEQLGLLHVRIGELYQLSFIDNSSTIEQYKKALDCFKKANARSRIGGTSLSLARLLLLDSTDVAETYLREGLESATEVGDSMSILSGYELYSYFYKIKESYPQVISLTKHLFSTFGEIPENPMETGLYTSIIKNCIQSYASMGQTDSARIFAIKLPLNDKYDSLFFYSAQRDIAFAENDWKAAFDHQENVHRIEYEMLQTGYDAQLVEVEKKYENSVLREELYKRNNRILVLVAVFSVLSLAAGGVFFLLRRLLRRQKAEIDRQTGIARKLHDTASRLELDLKSKASEADALKQEKQQEEETRKELEAMLTRQSSSNQELMRYYSMARKAMQDIVNIYDSRSSNPRHFMDEALEVARGFIMDMNSPRNAAAMIETAYPGFLKKLSADFPALQDDDLHLIALTCCGYPNGAVCTILGISESNLAVRKTRLAHKMGIDTSLTKYLRRRLATSVPSAGR